MTVSGIAVINLRGSKMEKQGQYDRRLSEIAPGKRATSDSGSALTSGTPPTGPSEPEAGGPPEPGRRNIVELLLYGGLLATIGSILVPIFRFILPPKAQAAFEGTVVGAQVGELPPNSGKIVRFGREPVILVNTPRGEYRAFSAICTHLGCTVQYRDDFQHIWCACHNGHYDLTGKNIQGPPPRPLPPFQVEIQGDEVLVRRAV